jgi:hypothetical protein
MIKHIVVWKLKEYADGKPKSENLIIMKKLLDDMFGKIPQIQKLEVGINIEPSDNAFDISLYSEFDSEKDLGIYQDHPIHITAKEFIKKVRQERYVVDYKL